MRRFALGLATLVAISPIACNIDDPEVVTPPPSGKAAEDIFGGTVDTTNTATVYLQGLENGQGYACSGTIIAVNGSTGYVLTAGHCVAGTVQEVVLGSNAQTGTGYQAVQQWQHPNFNTQTLDYDFGIVAFEGANGSTPIIPAAQTDPVAVNGATVELSGYGLTQNGPTTNRMHVNVVTSDLGGQIDTSLKMGYNQTNGKGACNGDSGGPAYFGTGASRVVAGVTSYGDQNCVQFGVSGRVAAVYASFIEPILNGQPPMMTCDTCVTSSTSPGGSCASTVTDCENDAACTALATCLQNCNNNDNACIQACANSNPNGISGYNAIFDCAYCSACTTLCDQSQCGASMSSVGATTGAGNPTTAVSTGTSTPANGAGGASGTTGSGTSSNGNSGGGDSGPVTVTKCACSVADQDSDGHGALAGLGAMAMLGLAFSARRKRG